MSSQSLISKVYLPSGNWYKLSTDSPYQGGKSYAVETPLGDLPVFVKAGAFIPKQNVIQYTGQQTDGILYLHFYKGSKNTSFTYYEDNGNTYAFEQGEFYKRSFEFDVLKNNISILPKQGSYVTRNKIVKLILHGFQKDEIQKIAADHPNAKIAGNIIVITTQLMDSLMQIKL